MPFDDFIRSGSFALSEGSIYERLRRDPRVEFDAHIAHAGLIYDDTYASILERTHREYLDVGQRYGLAMIAQTDTWRANRERVARSGFSEKSVNQDNARFLRDICAGYGPEATPIFIAGLMGCKGDAYKPQEALASAEAEAFHSFQADALVEGGVDFLLAATLPAYSEARGLGAAMARTALPFLVGFIVRGDGTVLDGTPLIRAIEEIDNSLPRAPTGYAINCVHPTVFGDAMAAAEAQRAGISRRVLLFQANTSARPPEELDGLPAVETEDADTLAEMMHGVRSRFHTPIVGGCCGTDATHIDKLASTYVASSS